MIEFEVKNMSCGHCVGAVTKSVNLVDPLAKVQIDVQGRKVTVESKEDRLSFIEALKTAGYPPA